MTKIVLFGAGPGIASTLRLIQSDPSINVVLVVPRINRKTGVPENSEDLIAAAQDLSIKVIQTTDINSPALLDSILSSGADLLANWGHGQMFGRSLLQLTKLGVVNFHPGLLPAGRGSGAVVGEIWNGSTEVGQVVHFMDENFDKGRIVHRRSFPITGYEYQDEINSEFAKGAPEFFIEAINKVLSGTTGEQVVGFGRYYPKPIPGDEIVDWSKPTDFLVRRIRSRSPNFLSRTFKNPDKQEIFINRVSPADIPAYFSPVGQVIDRSERGILVKTADTGLWIEECSSDGLSFFRPNFPIGTSFLSNWLHEFVFLSRQVAQITRDMEAMRSVLSSKVQDDSLDALFHCPNCAENRKSQIIFDVTSDNCGCKTCGHKFMP